MILLAVRNLLSERTRFAFSASGIGFAVFLITVLLGLYQGWNNRVGGFVEDVEVDAWIAREGTTDFINAASIVPRALAAPTLQREGVVAVYPMIVRPMQFYKDGKAVEVHLIGYDVGAGIGGPLKIVKGRGEPQPGEIVIDQVLSRTTGVGIGDILMSGEWSLEVVGIATGGNFAFTQAGFTDVEGASELLAMGDLVTFLLVDLDDETSVEDFATVVKAETPGVTVFTSQEFASATRHRILDNVIPIIGLIVILAIIVGLAITSLTIYTATIERTREFGIMKAVGFNNFDLYRLVVLQSGVTGLVGFVFGVILTLILAQFIDRAAAQFIVLVRLQDVLFVLVATVLMAAGAAIIPARRVGGIDPAVAFKG